MFQRDSAVENSFFLKIKEDCKVSRVKIFCQLIYYEVSIYLIYYKPHSLLSIAKMLQKVDPLKNFCDGERQFFSK